MRHGSPNPAQGDCAFEAVIQNNNDRSCFPTKYPMHINYYRNIWTTDMANRTVNSPWNTVGSQAWYKGWAEMATPGVYERGIFGDLILPGIACGVKKVLLIFNTSLESPHDPIYVINPSDFNVSLDTEIPILLAYNLAHYESMEPCSNDDVEASIKLVKDYQAGRYQFTRKDLHFLFGLQLQDEDKECKNTVDEIPNQPKYLALNSNLSRQEETRRVGKKSNNLTNDKEFPAEIDNSKEGSQIKIAYKLRGSMIEKSILEENGKFECPICRLWVKNIKLHFNKNLCINKIDANHFRQASTIIRNFKHKDLIKKKKNE